MDNELWCLVPPLSIFLILVVLNIRSEIVLNRRGERTLNTCSECGHFDFHVGNYGRRVWACRIPEFTLTPDGLTKGLIIGENPACAEFSGRFGRETVLRHQRDPRVAPRNDSLGREWEVRDFRLSGEDGDLFLLAIRRERYLVMKDPHEGGEYSCLRVPNEMNDAIEAHAWTFSLSKKEYLNLRKQT